MAFSGTSAPMNGALQRAAWVKKGLWAAVLAGLFAGELLAFLNKPQSELPVYMTAAERLRRDESIYPVETVPFTYPPLFALPFVPLTYLPSQAVRPVWYLVTVAAMAVILWRLRRRLAPVLDHARAGAWRPPVWVFWGGLLALAGRHLLSPLEYQSHDYLVFLCVMLAVDAWCGMRQTGAGLAAGVGAALKATPLLFAPLFLWQRRWRALAGMLAAVVLLSLLPDFLFPAADGQSWLVTWYRMHLSGIRPGESANSPHSWGHWNHLNQSLAGTLHRLFTPAPPGLVSYDVTLSALPPWALRLLTLAAQLAVAAGLFWATRPGLTARLPEGERAFQRLGEGAAVVTGMVLLSPMTSKSHFCVLVLPLAFCLADFLYRRRDPLVGLLLLLVFVVGTGTTKSLLGADLGNQVLSAGSLMWCSAALLVATGRVLLNRSHLLQVVPDLPKLPLVRQAA